ncbi:hypothetical protein Taro_038640 [Colocasia esculenta]|uniref:DYW domain-containing protein n=1 Tax=Colocasia esculenta TaxID=4460 RepID=A0A843WGF2_COLES|nr:hypothetical protein [Colocasia esculenta]
MNLCEGTSPIQDEEEIAGEGVLNKHGGVLFDVEEEDKVKNLSCHSKRLAIAFALVASRPGTPIRIIKNLKVCGDCHLSTKRDIVVRGRSHFHHFRYGVCWARMPIGAPLRLHLSERTEGEDANALGALASRGASTDRHHRLRREGELTPAQWRQLGDASQLHRLGGWRGRCHAFAACPRTGTSTVRSAMLSKQQSCHLSPTHRLSPPQLGLLPLTPRHPPAYIYPPWG